MIRHIFRMVWNRKRTTSLLFVELLVSYLVLCVVFSVGAYYVDNWRKPLGYDYTNVVNLMAIHPEGEEGDDEARRRILQRADQMMKALRTLPGVEGVSPVANAPYGNSTSNSGILTKDHQEVRFLMSNVTPEFKDVLRLEVVAGRWLNEADESEPWRPVVINRKLAKKLFGREDPLGKTIDRHDKAGNLLPVENESDIMKIVGVISDYRREGELSDSPCAAFAPMHLHDASRGRVPQEYLIRLAPGTPRIFEEQAMRLLHGVVPDYSLRFTPLTTARQSYFKTRLLPLFILAIVAGFLILMVGMGLVGVLWQNVAQRSKEFGLRRALGATGEDIRGQVLGEMLALTTLAVLTGTILFLQIPMLKLPGFITLKTSLAAILASVVVLYPFVSLCSLYPSWLASTVQPVEALQHD